LQQQLTTRHSDKQMTNRYQKRYLTCDIHCIYPQLSILIKQNPSTFRVLHIYQDNSRSDQHWFENIIRKHLAGPFLFGCSITAALSGHWLLNSGQRTQALLGRALLKKLKGSENRYSWLKCFVVVPQPCHHSWPVVTSGPEKRAYHIERIFPLLLPFLGLRADGNIEQHRERLFLLHAHWTASRYNTTDYTTRQVYNYVAVAHFIHTFWLRTINGITCVPEVYTFWDTESPPEWGIRLNHGSRCLHWDVYSTKRSCRRR
jgi:hypothetical protein